MRVREREEVEMADKQKLKLTLRHRGDGRIWKHQPVEIYADPDDRVALNDALIEMARDLDKLGSGSAWWADKYAARVQGIDETWRDFEIIGGGA